MKSERFKFYPPSVGRMTASEPNVQNIPTRTEIGREIREAFQPEKPLIEADYASIEVGLHGDAAPIRSGKMPADLGYDLSPRQWVTGYAVQNVGKAIEPQPTITINQGRSPEALNAPRSSAEQEAFAALNELSRKWRSRQIRSQAKPLNFWSHVNGK